MRTQILLRMCVYNSRSGAYQIKFSPQTAKPFTKYIASDGVCVFMRLFARTRSSSPFFRGHFTVGSVD